MLSFLKKEEKMKKKYFDALTAVCWVGKFSYFNAVNSAMSKRKMKKAIKSWNDVHESEDLKGLLDWLLKEGRREGFKQLKDYLNTMREEERHKYIQSLPEKDGERYRAFLTNYYLNRLPEAHIAAVDYSFCVLFSQYGKKIKYLTAAEAEEYALQAAKLCQNSYSCWEEYTIAFRVGVQFITGEEEKAEEYVNTEKRASIKLLASKYSPLRKVSWDVRI